MTRRTAILCAAAPIPLACLVLARLASCTSLASCAGMATWEFVAIAVAGSLIMTMSLSAAWALCLVVAAHRRTRTLPSAPIPDRLAEVADSVGVERLRHVASAERVAFCAGAIRPCVYITTALSAASDRDELAAILAHEAHHARRRHPLRRAVRRAVADVHVFLPVARWWSDRQMEREELAADATALRLVAPPALARALLRAASGPLPAASAAFDGSAEARVAQLLGEPTPPRRCPWTLWVASAVGGLAATAGALCVTAVAIG